MDASDLLWRHTYTLPSAQAWLELVCETPRPLIWISMPKWVYRWRDGLYEFVISCLDAQEIPFQIIDLKKLAKEGIPLTPTFVFRQIFHISTSNQSTFDLYDIALSEHAQQYKYFIITDFPLLPHDKQARWSNWLSRWARINENAKLEQNFVIFTYTSKPATLMKQHEHFIYEHPWHPPYSWLEAQNLLMNILPLKLSQFDKLWSFYSLSSMCGQDIFCAYQALSYLSIPQLGQPQAWKRLLNELDTWYAETIDNASANPHTWGTTISPLGLPEPHILDAKRIDIHSIERRIWRGQISWLLSAVDNIRYIIARKLSGYSKDLCLNECNNQKDFSCLICKAERYRRQKFANDLNRARIYRNRLAHYELLSYSEAQALWDLYTQYSS